MKSTVFESMLQVELPRYVKKQVPIAVCLNLGQIIVGYITTWSSPVIPKLRHQNTTPLDHVISETEASWVGSFIYVGCLATLTIGYLSNKLGRRVTLMLGGLVMLLSASTTTWATHLPVVLAGRGVAGLGCSLITVVSLVYIGEIASQNIRGTILTSTGVFQSLGMLLMYSVGPFASYAVIGYIMIAMSIVYLMGMLCIPESPVFFVIKDKEIEARTTLEKLGRTEDIETELQTMITASEQYKHNYINYHEVFTIKSNRVAFIITSILCFVQQCNGVIAVMMFTMTILENSLSVVEPTIGTIVIGLITFFGTIVAVTCVDKCGRRILLIISTGICCLTMAILGAYYYLIYQNHYYVDYLTWTPMATLVVSLFAFHIGLGIIPHTITGEMFRPNVRGAGAAMALSFGYVGGFLSTSSFSYIVLHVGSYVCFWIFAAINGLAFIFIICFVPETRGKSLTEIEGILQNYW